MNSIETVAKNIRLEVMQYAFFHLFPVAVAGTAMIMDIRTAKVDNGWMILFAFGMIGAGDIKLFCALGGIMGCESIIKCIFISFLTGAGISATLLIFNHNFCERILYFIEYVKCTVSTGKISSYRRKSIAAPENFHFTIPVFISVLLYAGGIY